MAKVRFLKGNLSNLPTRKEDGTFYVTEQGNLFADLQFNGQVKRIDLNPGPSDDVTDGGLPRLFVACDSLPSAVGDSVQCGYNFISEDLKFSGTGRLTYRMNLNNSPKKDFTITLQTAAQDVGWGFSSIYNLKANWIDHTHERDCVNNELWRQIVDTRSDYDDLPEAYKGSFYGTTKEFPFKLYINEDYQGLYTWSLPVNQESFGMTYENVTSGDEFVMRAMFNSNSIALTSTPSNFRRTTTLQEIKNERYWQVFVGSTSDDTFITNHYLTPLNNLLDFVANTTDQETFKTGISDYLDIQSAIDYYIFQYLINGIEGLGRNMLLATYDGQIFYMAPYFTQCSWGLNEQGNSILDAECACPADYLEKHNLLFSRIEQWYTAELKARYAELRQTVMNADVIFTKWEDFWYSIGKQIYDEDYTGTKYTNVPSRNITNINQLRRYLYDRFVYVDEQIDSMTIPGNCTGITFTTSGPLTLSGSVAAIAITTPLRTIQPVIWTTSDSSVISIIENADENENRTVTLNGVGAGSATITATCGNYDYSSTITVQNGQLVEHILAQNYAPDGSSFIYTAPIDLSNGQYIEVTMDISSATAAKENYISIGQNIDQFNSGGTKIHFYGSTALSSNLNEIRISLMYNASGARPVAPLDGTGTVVLRLDSDGLRINGTLYEPTSELTVWRNNMTRLTALTSFDIGSQEGTTRSHATYLTIKYYTLQTT